MPATGLPHSTSRCVGPSLCDVLCGRGGGALVGPGPACLTCCVLFRGDLWQSWWDLQLIIVVPRGMAGREKGGVRVALLVGRSVVCGVPHQVDRM
jgi:hypothetical protein